MIFISIDIAKLNHCSSFFLSDGEVSEDRQHLCKAVFTLLIARMLPE